jgi:hypothetical protein
MSSPYVDLGVAPSASNLSQSGGPFVNNAEIIFGSADLGAIEQNQSATSNPSAAASGAGSAVANPYAPNATTTYASGSGTSSLLLYGAIGVVGLLAVWYFMNKGK